MSGKGNFHVVPHGGGWAVKREDAQKPGSVHETKDKAMQVGRMRAMRYDVDLVIHSRTGILDSDSYRNDPMPIKDKTHEK